MDAEALDALRRGQEAESTRRLENAKKSPRQSTGGGGFKSNASGSGTDNAARSPGQTDGGLSGGVIHSADQEESIQRKAASGGVITNDDLGGAHDYLGHFATDGVLTKGHNAGMQKKGKSPLVKPIAVRGFRKLSGSASLQQGNAKYGTMSEAALGLRPPRHQREADAKLKASLSRAMKSTMMHDPVPLGRTDSQPRAISDVKLSVRHHKESIANDRKHIMDHKASIAAHEARMKMREKQLRGAH